MEALGSNNQAGCSCSIFSEPRPLRALVRQGVGVDSDAYALSPLDLIPDFIPVVGYLDDLIIVPAGIWLVITLIPPAVLDEHRKLADAARDQPVSLPAAAAIVVLWLIGVAACAWLVCNQLG
jgi:uncharacterized protein DUF1232